MCNRAELMSYSRDPNAEQKNLIVLDLAALDKAGMVICHPEHDIVAVKAFRNVAKHDEPGASGETLPLPGVTIKSVAPLGLLTMSHKLYETIDNVYISNDVYVLGFPNSIGVSNHAQIDKERPLIRKGIVSAVNRKHRTITLDCMVFHGNSGSPVLQKTQVRPANFRFDFIGIISEYVPFLMDKGTVRRTSISTNATGEKPTVVDMGNSGYSIVVPVDIIKELIGD
jgi:hypothetical protein